jgi:hypothetical protein
MSKRIRNLCVLFMYDNHGYLAGKGAFLILPIYVRLGLPRDPIRNAHI